MAGKKILSALMVGLSVAVIIIVTVLSITTDILKCCYDKLILAGKALLKMRRKRRWIEAPSRSKEWY